MNTIDPSEVVRLAMQRATAFEQGGEVDPSDDVRSLLAEFTEVLDHPSVDRDQYLEKVRGQARIMAVTPGASAARQAFFSELVDQISALIEP